MPITIFIEIAIGLVFVWFFLALAVMAIRETWAGIFRTRAKDMQEILRAMLEDPAQLQEQISELSIVRELYRHPMIQSLSKPITNSRFVKIIENRKKSGKPIKRAIEVTGQNGKTGWRWLPSYIPTKTFSLALYDVITTAGTQESVIQDALAAWQETVDATLDSLLEDGTLPVAPVEWEAYKSDVEKALSDLKNVIEPQLSQSELVTQVNAKVAEIKSRKPQIEQALNVLKPMIDELPRYLLSPEVIQGIGKLVAENSAAQGILENLHKTALRAAKESERAIAEFRTNIETWFDNTMIRAGGWYKRSAQQFAFIAGTVVAILLNVDSLAVISALYKEPTLRAAVVAEAGATVQGTDPNQAQGADRVGEKLEELGLPVGWHFADAAECALIKEKQNAALFVDTRCIVPGDTPEGVEADKPQEMALFWGLKGVGWLLSGAMAAQGAPFWFDIMKKLVNVRSSGRKPEEVEEERSRK
jgi:hypothetical protein